ncbi:MAG: PAS domain S-box protein [Thalassobaculum sp.]|uniref:PAS domain S-box protein n=1 Tax=Thalassobaculum sp. TaxID=2022740 RepID=UPI0032EB1747
MLTQFPNEPATLTAASPIRALQAAGGVLDLIPVGIYLCDPDGNLIHHNAAAAELWGRRPALGDPAERYCGAYRLHAPDGTLLTQERSPTAVALRERRPVRDVEAIATHPDGSRVSLLLYSTPVFDEHDGLAGAIGVLVDVADRQAAEQVTRRLAAIVDSSDDAILALDRDGTVVSWNHGATQLYQYTEDEVVGRPISMLIPPDRGDEETDILNRVLRGERVERYQTVRLRRDGSTVDVSLTISPVLDRGGRIVGVSKIARDITERKRANERRDLLLAEMNHRVKNLLVMASGIISLSARSATSVKGLAADVASRLAALARAHELTLPARPAEPASLGATVSLHALIDTIVTPFDERAPDGTRRVAVSGPDIEIAAGSPLTGMALLLHEFATNAAKHGAFAVPGGTVDVQCAEAGGRLVVVWTERGGPAVRPPGEEEAGFGSRLVDLTVRRQLAGEITRRWHPDGLVLRLEVERDRLNA